MSMSFGPGHSRLQMKQIDGEESLRLWLSLGSLGRVVKHLGINPQTGLPFSRETICASAYRYILSDPKQAIEKYLKPDALQRGEEFDEQRFWESITRRAWQYLYPKKRAAFYKQYGLTELAKKLAGERHKA